MTKGSRLGDLRRRLILGRWLIIASGLLLIVAGIGLEESTAFLSELNDRVRSVVAESCRLLGVALVVSYGLLGWYKRRENEYLGRMVYKTIFGPFIDDIAVDHIREEIGLNPVMRKEATWVFEVTEEDGHLLLTQTAGANLENRGGSNQKVQPPRRRATDGVCVRSFTVLKEEKVVHTDLENAYEITGLSTVRTEMIAGGKFVDEVRCSHYSRLFVSGLKIEIHFLKGYQSSEELHLSAKAEHAEVTPSDRVEQGLKKSIFVPFVLPHQGISIVVSKVDGASSTVEAVGETAID